MARRKQNVRRSPKARPRGIIELSSRGFGFVKTAEGDFFVPPSKTGGAFPGDLVEVAPYCSGRRRHEGAGSRGGCGSDGVPTHGRRPEARVARVVTRACKRLVGRYEIAEPFGVVVPENPAIAHDVFTLRADAPYVEEGDLVEVEMVEYPTRHTAATGRVLRVIGKPGTPGVEIDLIVAENDLETKFSPDALEQAQACSIDVEAALAEGFRDCRGDFAMTIDPVDARDFDDAVSCRFEGELYHLSVHIADVSAFVPFDSPLDLSARRRATSVYLVDRVIPMLPERLSNQLCSLMPGVPRRVLTVDAVVRPDGSVERFNVHASVIESKARLSYDQAQALIEATDDQAAKAAFGLSDTPHGALPLDAHAFSQARQSVRALDGLAQALFKRRYAAGCMDFTRVEARVKLDSECVPIGIECRTRTRATGAIEEAMVLANALVAEWLFERDLPCVRRVHDVPDAEGLCALWPLLQESRSFVGVNKAGFLSGNPKALQEVLAIASRLPERELVNALLLRSMTQARYAVDDDPHYGLALERYCHFTSPIRRYPDLLVHRMVKVGLFGRTESFGAQKDMLPWMAEHSSHAERVAEKAARDSQTVKLIEYLETMLYQRFDGIISGVSTFGATVRLDNTATGLVPVEELGREPFTFDYRRHALTGTETGTVWRMGQSVTVRLVEADHARRLLSFDKIEKVRPASSGPTRPEGREPAACKHAEGASIKDARPKRRKGRSGAQNRNHPLKRKDRR